MGLLLLKISGKVLAKDAILNSLLQELHHYCTSHAHKYLIVHGGGMQLGEDMRSRGVEPCFDNLGHRITLAKEIPAVQQILGGQIRLELVQRCRSLGISAVGISGSDGNLIEGSMLQLASADGPHEEHHTGVVERCNTTLPSALLDAGFVPIINSVSCDINGRPLNINADDVAAHLAVAYSLDTLIFLSDTPGIMGEKKLVRSLNRKHGEQLIDLNIVHSGMRKKLMMSLHAAESGVAQILIGTYTRKGDLEMLIDHKQGTRIYDG